jgi:type 1 glutamine amidotransferase
MSHFANSMGLCVTLGSIVPTRCDYSLESGSAVVLIGQRRFQPTVNLQAEVEQLPRLEAISFSDNPLSSGDFQPLTWVRMWGSGRVAE